MKFVRKISLCFILLIGYCFGTDAILKRNATLRSDPSTAKTPVAILSAGEDVELISTTLSHGYYNVRTAEGQTGWVYGRRLQITEENLAATTANIGTPSPVNTGSAAVSSEIPTNWEKPEPNQTQYEGVDGTCGATGDGGDSKTNGRKNRTDAPASYQSVSWKAFQSLPYPKAPRSLADWTAPQLSIIQPYEGIPVSLVGFLDAVKVEKGGSGESTNCHFTNPEEVDWHMPLVEHSLDQEATSIVVETTPRVRGTHPKWTVANLSEWVKSDQPVRISGWALIDPEHRAHLGKYRSTLWEIHPITRIEVFKEEKWLDLDDLP